MEFGDFFDNLWFKRAMFILCELCVFFVNFAVKKIFE